MKKAISNAVLIYEKDGEVAHRFCTEAEARSHLDDAARLGSVASMLAGTDMPADLLYDVSPNFRDRVDEIKVQMRFQLAVRDALNRQGVPADKDLRQKVYLAIKDLRGTALRPFIPV